MYNDKNKYGGNRRPAKQPQEQKNPQGNYQRPNDGVPLREQSMTTMDELLRQSNDPRPKK